MENNNNLAIAPVRPGSFQLSEHRMRRFDATVNAALKDELENPKLWVNVAPKINIADELRIIADDLSWVAYGICLFSSGSQAKIKIIQAFELDVVDGDAETESLYIAKLRGIKKWCIQDVKTAQFVREGIDTKAAALAEIDELVKILGR